MKAKHVLRRLSFKNFVSAIKADSKPIKPAKELADSYPNSYIRTMTFDEVEWTRSGWAVDEDWSSTVGGLLPYYNQDPNGFYMLEKKQGEDSEKIGSISVITYNGLELGFVGFYIIKPEYREKGFGRFLLESTLEHSANERSCKTFGLDCLKKDEPLYEKFGFKTYTTDHFWKLDLTKPCEKEKQPIDQQSLEDTSTLSETLFSYDTKVFGCARPNYIKGLCMKPSTVTIVSETNNEIDGYGIMSERVPAKEEPNKSYRIGPLYADTADSASKVLEALLQSVPKTPSTIFLESPETNKQAAELLTKFGFQKYLSMPKMYKGEPPKHDEDKIFSYSSVAFG